MCTLVHVPLLEVAAAMPAFFSMISWQEPANTIILVSATLVSLGVIYRYTVRPFVRGVRGFMERQHRIMGAVAFVEMELKPNGGSSLRDAVDKLVHRTNILEHQVLHKDKPAP